MEVELREMEVESKMPAVKLKSLFLTYIIFLICYQRRVQEVEKFGEIRLMLANILSRSTGRPEKKIQHFSDILLVIILLNNLSFCVHLE